MQNEPIFQSKSFGFKVTVFEDHIEYKSLGQTKIISISNISDMTKEPLSIKVRMFLNSGEKVDIVLSKNLKEFMEVVRKLMQKSKSGVSGEASYIGELEKLAQLKDRGVITEEEFQAKKKQILGL